LNEREFPCKQAFVVVHFTLDRTWDIATNAGPGLEGNHQGETEEHRRFWGWLFLVPGGCL
jgi:hypothetical protein